MKWKRFFFLSKHLELENIRVGNFVTHVNRVGSDLGRIYLARKLKITDFKQPKAKK